METNKTLEIIRSEIERRKGYISVTHFAEELLSFLSTLESEKPMNQKGLEREIERCLWKLSDDPSNEELRMFARNFYDLGCRHTAEKYDEIEYNRQRAEESVCKDLEKEIDFQTFSKEMGAVFALPKERTKNTEEEPLRWEYEIARHFAQWGAKHLADDSKTSPNDLEEAAEKYSKERAEGHILYDWVHAFIAGAKWQKEQDEKEQADLFTIVALDAAQRAKEQMMKEAVEGEVVKDWDNNLSVKSGVICGFKFGEKVRVIVLPKED